jgi:hypothetical protein
LELEHANLRAALSWMLDPRDAEPEERVGMGLRLAAMDIVRPPERGARVAGEGVVRWRRAAGGTREGALRGGRGKRHGQRDGP